RQAADEHPVAAPRQLAVGGFDAVVPVAPAGAQQLVFGAAMPGKLHAVDRIAGGGELLADEPHLGRCAGQAVDQEDPVTPAVEPEAGIDRHARVHRAKSWSSNVSARSISSVVMV